MSSCFPVFEFYRICMFLSNILFGHVSPEACPFFIYLSPAANSAEILLLLPISTVFILIPLQTSVVTPF